MRRDKKLRGEKEIERQSPISGLTRAFASFTGHLSGPVGNLDPSGSNAVPALLRSVIQVV